MEQFKKLVPILITFVVVLIVELIKVIVKRVAKQKNVELSKKVLEYPLYLGSVVLVFISVMLYMRYGINNTDWGHVCTIAGVYAAGANSIYMLVIQAIRKIISKIYTKVKASKNAVKELPTIIVDSVTEATKELIDKVGNLSINTTADTAQKEDNQAETASTENSVDQEIKDFAKNLFNLK